MRNHGDVTHTVQLTNPGVRPWTDMRTGERARSRQQLGHSARSHAGRRAGDQRQLGGPRVGTCVGDGQEDPLKALPAQREDGVSPTLARSSGIRKGRFEVTGRMKSRIPIPLRPQLTVGQMPRGPNGTKSQCPSPSRGSQRPGACRPLWWQWRTCQNPRPH